MPNGAIDFQYDDSWLAWERNLPLSLSMPLREDRYSGDIVIAVFENLLPDNPQVRKQLAERVKAGGYDAYSLLDRVGRDCIGAIQFLHEDHEPEQAGQVIARPISSKEIAKKIRELKITPLGVDETEDFRIALAGAQDKTALLHFEGQWHIPHGTTATTHILKPQIGMVPGELDLRQSVENEHFCMRILAGLDLPVANTEIADFEDQRVLVVERFDRLWTKSKRLLRLPQEDFCQALSVPPAIKYDADGGPGMNDILNVLKESSAPSADQRTFIKSQIAFWLLGATDGHAKNFSLSLQSGSGYRLAPLYDVMSAQPLFDAAQLTKRQFKMALAVGRNRHYTVDSILPRHFAQTAARCGIPTNDVHEICEELLSQAEQAIESALSEMPRDFPQYIAESVAQGFFARLRAVAIRSA